MYNLKNIIFFRNSKMKIFKKTNKKNIISNICSLLQIRYHINKTFEYYKSIKMNGTSNLEKDKNKQA